MFSLMLIIAAFSYSLGGYFMKLSNGFSQLGPTSLVFALFSLGAGIQIIAMRHEEMTVTYIIVLGLEAITAFLLGTFFLKETSSITKLSGIALVLAGIILLRLGEA
ncbi:MAG: SMR family transporter [Deinococcales bacterium]